MLQLDITIRRDGNILRLTKTSSFVSAYDLVVHVARAAFVDRSVVIIIPVILLLIYSIQLDLWHHCSV